ncbi:hypothetical protein [Nitrosomonas sp.]|uniref:hypothetical protein n=1 Tax=Nitrosomonas sp. TaxID=42353 RepID=UPI0027317C03|nr:hypothetical protein [Nitrosomonas sp.]MDP2223383.1 hypothetical protein [Nitrosomonas sp.]
MARKASGTEQLEVAMERLKKAKTAAELRAAQAIVLPLSLGLSLEPDSACHWPFSRCHLQNAYPV